MSVWFWSSYLGLWVLVLLQSVTSLLILRQIGLFFVRLKQGRRNAAAASARSLAVGEVAPPLKLPDLSNPDLSVVIPSPDQRTLVVVWLAPRCPSCGAVADGVRALAEKLDTSTMIAVLASGKKSGCRTFREEHGLHAVPFGVLDRSCSTHYFVNIFPYVAVIAPSGEVITSQVVTTREELEEIVTVQKELQDVHPSLIS